MKIAKESAGPTVVVLAAGIGSRFGGLKQLEPVGAEGETLLEYSIFDAVRAGFDKAVLVVRPEMETSLRRRFEGGMGRRVAVEFVRQRLDDLPGGSAPPDDRIKPWGTGHAVLAARTVVDGPFAVINADDFYGVESFATLYRFLSAERPTAKTTWAMVGFAVGATLSASGPVSRALCRVDGRDRLEGIVEVLEMSQRGDGGVYTDPHGREVVVHGDALVSMNLWGFEPVLFAELEERFQNFLDREGHRPDSEFRVPDIVQELLTEGRIRVQVLRGAGQWCGITYPDDRQRVAAAIGSMTASGLYPVGLWQRRAESQRTDALGTDSTGSSRNE